ncbi:MAG: magnesium transporter [Candidatus Bipolaricaulota bacterium]
MKKQKQHRAPSWLAWLPLRAREDSHLRRPVMAVIRQDAPLLRLDFTVGEALESVRAHGIGDRPFYFYVVDEAGTLVGVVPTRRLLTAPLDRRLADLVVRPVRTVPKGATVLQAYEMMLQHKLLALPVVDEGGHLLGLVDVNALLNEPVDPGDTDAVFETVGLHVAQARLASPAKALRVRFPWLVATLASGVLCALLISVFEVTLEKSLLLAFFLTLALGLGESVSMQSAAVTILALRAKRPSWRWYVAAVRREAGAALLLGAVCGLIVGAVVWGWLGERVPAVAIGLSLVFSITAASTFGLSIPTLLHALKLDPKIAAGPLVLAVSDIWTVLFYFGIATLLL